MVWLDARGSFDRCYCPTRYILNVGNNSKPRLMRFSIFIFALILFGCSSSPSSEFDNDKTFPEVQSLKSFKKTTFLPTLESSFDISKNGIYAASLLMAWDEIKKKLSPIREINGDVLKLMNQSKTYQNVLLDNEFYSSIEIEDGSIKAKAFFKKSLPFKFPLSFYEDDLKFNNETVTSFGFWGYCNFAKIKYYNNDDDFAISLNPKDSDHEIILIKSKFANNTPLITYIENLSNNQKKFKKKRNDHNFWKYDFNDNDRVLIPTLKFHIEHDFDEIVGSDFEGKNSTYSIVNAYQRTAFVLNERGAEVESYSTVETTEELVEEELPKPKMMLFDKTFLILLKRKNSANPYFAALVANDEIIGK